MILLTNDAEELEESLTDETATAKEPRPEADDLRSRCPGLLQPRYDETATAEVLHSDVADELTTDEPQINGHVYIVPWRPEEFIFSIFYFVSLLHLPPPSMNTCHSRPLATSTSFRALQREHFGIFSLLLPRIYAGCK